MSFDVYMAWLTRREQNVDRLREAERHRLVRQVLAARRRRDRVLTQTLTWVGRCLVVWGQHLQERYDSVVESPAAHAVNHASH
jgi:hypothetical protein